MKKLLLFMLLSTSVYAERPEDLRSDMVPIAVDCVDTINRMADLLISEFGEAPVVSSQMSDTTTIILFVNKDHTSSSVVVHKAYKEHEEACIIWGGKSPSGESYMTNPNPIYSGTL